MASQAVDSYKLLTALKATGKEANYSAEELANAIAVAQQGADVLTKSIFDAKMAEIDAKFDLVRADIKAEVKSSQLQNLLWLSGITLASNGVVIAMLARATKVF